MLDGEDDAGTQTDQAAQDAANAEAASATEGTEGQDTQAQEQDGAGESDGAAGDTGATASGKPAPVQNAITDAAAEAKAKDTTRPFQDRINELTKNWRGTERELEASKARIAELEAAQKKPAADQTGDGTQQQVALDPAVIEQMVEQRAAKKAAVDRANESFDSGCNLAFDKGVKQYGDAFTKALETCGSMGVLERAVVEDILVTDAPQEVLYQLGSNPDLALKIAKLPPAKRIVEFTRLSLKAPAKPATSKAATPITPINSGGGNKPDFDPHDPKLSDEEWHAQEDARDRARRAG